MIHSKKLQDIIALGKYEVHFTKSEDSFCPIITWDLKRSYVRIGPVKKSGR